MHNLFGVGLTETAASLRELTVRVVDRNRSGSGSGLVWTDGRTVVTNAHVVRGRRAVVQFDDGSWVEARAARRDAQQDLVALELPFERLARPAVRDAATLRPGELVFAVGNPLGVAGAVSAGIVHCRSARFVLADVRLLPGNSGGPLADVCGRVVGINSMVVNGLACAVPSERVRQFLGESAGSREVERVA